MDEGAGLAAVLCGLAQTPHYSSQDPASQSDFPDCGEKILRKNLVDECFLHYGLDKCIGVAWSSKDASYTLK